MTKFTAPEQFIEAGQGALETLLARLPAPSPIAERLAAPEPQHRSLGDGRRRCKHQGPAGCQDPQNWSSSRPAWPSRWSTRPLPTLAAFINRRQKARTK